MLWNIYIDLSRVDQSSSYRKANQYNRWAKGYANLAIYFYFKQVKLFPNNISGKLRKWWYSNKISTWQQN